MGQEYITQPQIFLLPITAVGGIQNGLYSDPVPPLITSFFTWTSTANVSATTFPLVGFEPITNRSGAYIVTVGGVVQSPTNYIVNPNTRALTFDFTVNPNTEVVVTQIGTTVSLVSVASLTADRSVFRNVNADRLLVTNLTALSAEFRVVDITQFELSGFEVRGNAAIVGRVGIGTTTPSVDLDVVKAAPGSQVIVKSYNLSNAAASQARFDLATGTPNAYSILYQQDGSNPFGAYSHGPGLTGGMFFIAASASPIVFRQDTSPATEIMRINRNGNVGIGTTAPNELLTVAGTISAISTSVRDLSSRFFTLVHDPANDGIDPILDIGETATEGLSGFRIRYEETTNRLIGSSRTGTTILTSFMITTNTGQVGISGLPAPGQALTVAGSTTVAGGLIAGPGTTTFAPITILSGGPLTTATPGTLERNQFGLLATPVSNQRGIITAPQTFLLNADRTGPVAANTPSSFFGAACNLIAGKYAYKIIANISKTNAVAAAVTYGLSAASGTIASHFYTVISTFNNATVPTSFGGSQQMSNYLTANFNTLVQITPANGASASFYPIIIDGVLDISADVIGLTPLYGFNAVPTTSLVRAGSYFQIWPFASASNTNVSIGTWAAV